MGCVSRNVHTNPTARVGHSKGFSPPYGLQDDSRRTRNMMDKDHSMMDEYHNLRKTTK
jgi:hypothetical protein